jgi:hypothetical protein
MSDQRRGDEANHASGQQNAEHGKEGVSNGAVISGEARKRYVDPAEDAMSRNHNLSPPIHPKLEQAMPGLSS